MDDLLAYCWEVVLWKHAVIEGVERYWSNAYHFITDDVEGMSSAYDLCHNLIIAEQFMYTGDVEIFGAIAWRWHPLDTFATKEEIYIFPGSRQGNRVHETAGAMIPWEYALLFQREAEQGRSARTAIRYCLTSDEVVPFGEDSLAIPNYEPWGPFQTQLVLYWLNNSPMHHAIYKRDNELLHPASWRRVNRYSIGSLTKLSSIEDAQARKTPRALPYQELWRIGLRQAFQSSHEIIRLIGLHPEGLAKDDVQALETMAGYLKGTFQTLLDYWTEGVKPVLMLNWRPTSGLDPLSINVQNIVGDAAEGIDALAPILKNLQEYPDDYIPYEGVLPFIQEFSYWVLHLERCGAMRWTGTPIRGLPKVYD